MYKWKCVNCNFVNEYTGGNYCINCSKNMTPPQHEVLLKYSELLKDAEKGDSESSRSIYHLFKSSDVWDENEDEALTWLIKAANDNSEAQFELGQLLLFNGNPQAFKWYYRSMRKGNIKGKFQSAECYMVGFGVEKNEEIGFELMLECANESFLYAMEKVGLYYSQGKGCQKNDNLSFYWLEKVTQNKDYELDADSANELAYHYFNGEVTSTNVMQALHYFNYSYNKGNPWAGIAYAKIINDAGKKANNPSDSNKLLNNAKNIFFSISSCDNASAAAYAKGQLKELYNIVI